MSVNTSIVVILKLIPVLIGLYYWSVLTSGYRLILSQIILAFVVENVARYISIVLHQDNAWLFNIYGLAQALLLGIAGIFFIEKKKLKPIIKSALVAITLVWLWNVTNNNLHEFFNWFFVVSALLVVLIYITVLINSSLFKTKKILLQPTFLLSIAFIIYYGSTIPLLSLSNQLVKKNITVAAALFYINDFANIICYSLIAVAFYLNGRQANRTAVSQQ